MKPQIIVNWYRNEADYIAPHSDCQVGMKSHAEIAVISLNKSDEQARQLVFTAKQSKNLHGEHLYRKVIVEAKHGTIISMHGDLQDHFRHRIPKARHIDTSRISPTFRKFR